MEGWLQKKSSGLSFGFSKKYARLEYFSLNFYSNPTDRKTQESFDLRQTTSLSDNTSAAVASSAKDEAANDIFLTYSSGKKKLTLRIPNADEKKCWFNLLIPFNGLNGIVSPQTGIPLTPVLATGISMCIDILSHDGCVNGIFREPAGKTDEVRTLFTHFIRGNTGLPQGAVDVHAVSNVLKKMLKELPETIFTNHLYEQAIAQNLNTVKLGFFMTSLPVLNRRLMTSLVELLYLIVCHEKVTGMNARALSQALAPSFAMRKENGQNDSSSSSSSTPNMEAFWTCMISNKDTILYGTSAPTSAPVSRRGASQERSMTNNNRPVTPLSQQVLLTGAASNQPNRPSTPLSHAGGISRSSAASNQQQVKSTGVAIPPATTTLSAHTSPTASEPAPSPMRLASTVAPPNSNPANQNNAHTHSSHSSLLLSNNSRENDLSLLSGGDNSLLAGGDEQDLDGSLMSAGDASLDEKTGAGGSGTKQMSAKPPLVAVAPSAQQPHLASSPAILKSSSPLSPSSLSSPSSIPSTLPSGPLGPRASPKVSGMMSPSTIQKAGRGFDDGDEDEDVSDDDENSKPRRGVAGASVTAKKSATPLRRSLPVSRTKKPSVDDDDDDINLFEDSAEDVNALFSTAQSPALTGARKGLDARQTKFAPAPVAAKAIGASTTASAAPAAKPSVAPAATSSNKLATKSSTPADSSLKNSFGFDDSMDGTDSGSLQLTADKHDGSMDLEMSLDEKLKQTTPSAVATKSSVVTTSSPLPPKPSTTASSSPAAPPLPVSPSPNGSLSLSTGDGDDDFTLGSQLPVKSNDNLKAPVVASSSKHPQSSPTLAKSVSVSAASNNDDTLGLGDDNSLLSLGGSEQEASIKMSPVVKPVAAAKGIASSPNTLAAPVASSSSSKPKSQPTNSTPDGSLTFGDDTDFDISQLEDGSIKENVFGGDKDKAGKPATTATAITAPVAEPIKSASPLTSTSKNPYSLKPHTPKSKTSTLAVTSTAPADDSLLLSLGDDSASLRVDQKKTPAQSTAAPKPATSTQKPNTSTATDDELSLNLDSQLNTKASPTPTKVMAAAAANATVVVNANVASTQSKPGVTATASKPTTATPAKPSSNVKSQDDESLDLFSAADGDQSLLLSGLEDDSEAPTVVKPAAASVLAGRKLAALNPSATTKSAPTPLDSKSKSVDAPTPTAATSSPSAPIIASLAVDTAALHKLESENLTLIKQVRTLTDQLTTKNHELEDSLKKVDELRELNKSSATATAQEQQQRYDRLLSEQTQLLTTRYSTQITALQHRAEQSDAQSLTYLSQKDSLMKDISSLQDRLQEKEHELSSIKSEVKSMEREKGYLQQELNQRDSVVNEKRTALAILQKKYDDLTKVHHETLSSTHASSLEQSRLLRDSEERICQTERDREEYKHEHELALKKIESIQEELVQERRKKSQAAVAVNENATPSLSATSLHSAMLNMKADYELECTKYEHTISSLRHELTLLQEHLNEAHTKYRTFQSTHTSLQTAYEMSQTSLRRVEMQLLKGKDNVEFLTSAVDANMIEAQRKMKVVLSTMVEMCVREVEEGKHVKRVEEALRQPKGNVSIESLSKQHDYDHEEYETHIKELSGLINNSQSDNETEVQSRSFLSKYLTLYPKLQEFESIIMSCRSNSSLANVNSVSSSKLTPSPSAHRPGTSASIGSSKYRSTLEFIPYQPQQMLSPSYLQAQQQQYRPRTSSESLDAYAARNEEKQQHPSMLDSPPLSAGISPQVYRISTGTGRGGAVSGRFFHTPSAGPIMSHSQSHSAFSFTPRGSVSGMAGGSGSAGNGASASPSLLPVAGSPAFRLGTPHFTVVNTPISPMTPLPLRDRRGSAPDPTRSHSFRRLSLEENKRQLNRIELETRAGLDASHARLRMLGESMADAEELAKRKQQMQDALPRTPISIRR